MRSTTLAAALLALCFTLPACVSSRGDATQPQWRELQLIKDGKVHPDWKHTGFGALVVDADSLRTEADGRGLGLLVFSKEKFGDCRLRVVYRVKDARANSGVYIRIDEGILGELGKQQIAVTRDAGGKLSEAELQKMMEASEKEQGPWYAVHHGYEVQIADGGNETHGTGAIYSLAKRTGKPVKPPGEWRTMIITLRGTTVEVELDGVMMSAFDSAGKDLPQRKVWHEPKREPVRPTHGYIGLQTHDPGEVVWFREISVAKLKE